MSTITAANGHHDPRPRVEALLLDAGMAHETAHLATAALAAAELLAPEVYAWSGSGRAPVLPSGERLWDRDGDAWTIDSTFRSSDDGEQPEAMCESQGGQVMGSLDLLREYGPLTSRPLPGFEA